MSNPKFTLCLSLKCLAKLSSKDIILYAWSYICLKTIFTKELQYLSKRSERGILMLWYQAATILLDRKRKFSVSLSGSIPVSGKLLTHLSIGFGLTLTLGRSEWVAYQKLGSNRTRFYLLLKKKIKESL